MSLCPEDEPAGSGPTPENIFLGGPADPDTDGPPGNAKLRRAEGKTTVVHMFSGVPLGSDIARHDRDVALGPTSGPMRCSKMPLLDHLVGGRAQRCRIVSQAA